MILWSEIEIIALEHIIRKALYVVIWLGIKIIKWLEIGAPNAFSIDILLVLQDTSLNYIKVAFALTWVNFCF